LQINHTEERKRLFISVGTALVIHIVILILIGLNRSNFDFVPEFGPLTVQVSLESVPAQPEEPPRQDEAFKEDSAPRVEEIKPVIQEAPAPVVSKTKPVPVTEKTVAAAAPVYKPPQQQTAPSVDDTISSIMQRSSGSTAGTDVRALFGDDPVPASTDSPTAAAASSASAGSEVISSAAPVKTVKTAPVQDAKEEVSVLASTDLASLDASLNAADTAGQANARITDSNSTSTGVSSGPVSGNTPNVAFTDPNVKRKLLKWNAPVIPAEARQAGISQYTVKIQFDIDPSGITSNPEIIVPSGNTAIDTAVRSALRTWLFEESLSEQKKVRAVLTYVIEIK